MPSLYKIHPWKIIEEGFHADYNEVSESCFSIGNGRMGQRAYFEERYSGSSCHGSYLAGVLYREKTLLPDAPHAYRTQVLNAPNWIGIDISIDGEIFDLATCKVKGFRRVLHMKQGYLERSFTARLVSGKEVKIEALRFISMYSKNLGVVRYRIKPLNFEGNLNLVPLLDAEVRNRYSLSEEINWRVVSTQVKKHSGYLLTETKDGAVQVCTGMKFSIFKNGEKLAYTTEPQLEEGFLGCRMDLRCKPGDTIEICKYAVIVSSVYYNKARLVDECRRVIKKAYRKGVDVLLKKHTGAWAEKWRTSDIVISGDDAAQQGVRFHIFQLFQSYSGDDKWPSLSTGGFTGERYHGCMRWDMDLFGVPFYLSAYNRKAAYRLLVLRYRQLSRAIENAERMGFTNGAALFPLTTFSGEEYSNQWRLAEENIHRNGAVAYAIFHYVHYSGDRAYLAKAGLEILIAICRYWVQRVHWSKVRNKYMLFGVTGPNEYERQANNNWYTNFLAVWCLRYTLGVRAQVAREDSQKYRSLVQKIQFNEPAEVAQWQDVIENMYLPEDTERGIFLQQDGYLDKEWKTVDDLSSAERPLLLHWTREHMLRSPYIQRADVLQGILLFNDHFDKEVIRRNFEFYESRTVHESSLSPFIHSILAVRTGRTDKAFELYRKSARLDLDNRIGNTENGLHITSMAGTWMAIVYGFGGMKVEKDRLSFDPCLPEGWKSYSFQVHWRGHWLKVVVDREGSRIENLTGQSLQVNLNGALLELKAHT